MRHRAILTISAIGTMAACFMLLLGPSASEPGATGANGRQYTTVTIDGCEYIQRAYDGHTFHKGSCRNPIHWEHVLQDTSWYWRVRESERLRTRAGSRTDSMQESPSSR